MSPTLCWARVTTIILLSKQATLRLNCGILNYYYRTPRHKYDCSRIYDYWMLSLSMN